MTANEAIISRGYGGKPGVSRKGGGEETADHYEAGSSPAIPHHGRKKEKRGPKALSSQYNRRGKGAKLMILKGKAQRPSA